MAARSMIKTAVRQVISELTLPRIARNARTADRRGLPLADPGCEAVIAAGCRWLGQAQDHSASHDGGFARDFSLLTGWSSSYPETSGYIVPTLLAQTGARNDVGLRERARRCLDWLIAIQFPEGGFQGGKIDQQPRVPVTFNTGQILLGLAAGAAGLDREKYLEPMHRAAQWLVETQDADGCWRKHPTPFGRPGEKAYETHVSWGLFEAARVAPGEGFGEAGLRQVRWALTKQRPNGWFESNCLDTPKAPLTHTIGYVLRGIAEAHLWSQDGDLLRAACLTADGVLPAVEEDGRLPGRLDSEWRPAAWWVCLTGSAQIAHSLFLLARITRNERYAAAAFKLNEYVRRTVSIAGDPNAAGGVRGSFPVDGDYGHYQYLNWACKFLIDSCAEERAFAARRA
jgi:hypothetical protein